MDRYFSISEQEEDNKSSAGSAPEGLECLKGTVEYIKYTNPDNGYTICELSTDDDDIITIVGVIPYITEGDSLTVYGGWVHNPKYGQQFRVDRYEKVMPSDEASILRYLSSGAIKGIGAKTAQKMINMFGAETLSVMEEHPEWLSQIPGISLKKAKEIGREFKEKSGIRNAMLFFREWFGSSLTVRIYKKWGGAAVDIAKNNPYRLCDEIDGIGFERSDEMARSLGLDRESPERISSGIAYMLKSNATAHGHTCLPKNKLIEATARLLMVPAEKITSTLEAMIRDGRLKQQVFDSNCYIYDSYMFKCEQYIAEKLEMLDRMHVQLDADDIVGFVEFEEKRTGIRYAELQKKAISGALRNGVMILTGGPGTGKTTVVRALMDIFDHIGMRVALAAPTGRAAKRLSESSGCEAKTIHRLLEVDFRGGEDGYGARNFCKNETDLLEEDVIIIDEASMVDCLLMCSLLKAVKNGARFIFIGDADQLPSVGAGNVLHDLIDSDCFLTVRLTEIFRQAEQSLIIRNAHAINNGIMPDLTAKNKDFFFVPRQGDAAIAQTVADLYENRLPKAYGDMARFGTQVITPSKRGEAGTENLNKLIQSIHNPPSGKKKEHKYRDTVFREGDRVMQIKNNYEIQWTSLDGTREGMGIFNGDMGCIKKIVNSESLMEIEFDDRTVEYGFDMLDELEPAYAVTVHKSQGSEYPIVVIPAYHAPPLLLSRNLFYTAVTRAKNMVIIVGEEEIVAQMVKNNSHAMRYTGLCEMLTKRN